MTDQQANLPANRAELAAWDVVYELLNLAFDRCSGPGTTAPRFTTVRAAIHDALCLIPAEGEE